MDATTIFFYIFAAGAILSSVAVVVARIPLYSAIALILDFFFFAGLYVLLSAHFMAIIQILVYGGAIMVLFMFIIMLLNLREEHELITVRTHHAVAIILSMSLMVMMGTALNKIVDMNAVQAATVGTTEDTLVAVPSRVPGLYGALDEASLEQGFKSKVSKWSAGTAKSSDGKYRPVDPSAPTVVPTMLSGGTPEHPEPASFGTAEPMSLLLVNRFVVPFELTALMLLGAIVGAVVIAKKRL